MSRPTHFRIPLAHPLHRAIVTACGLIGTTFTVTVDRKRVSCKNCLRTMKARAEKARPDTE